MAEEHRKKLSFDPTINAGHILTFVTMMVAMGTAYSLLDKRVGVLEEKATNATTAAAERQTETKETLRDLRSDVKELQRSINDIGRAVAAKRP